MLYFWHVRGESPLLADISGHGVVGFEAEQDNFLRVSHVGPWVDVERHIV